MVVNYSARSEFLAWMDLEMTGLDPEKDTILEISTLLTDGDLNMIAEGPQIEVQATREQLEAMEDWPTEHHKSSGLWDRCLESKFTTQMAEEATIRFFSLFAAQGRLPLAGNSIWQDRRFLAKHMPRLESFFHYRIVDVSSIKELYKRWGNADMKPPKKVGSHRALSDILESLKELRYYKEHFFQAKSS